MADEEKLQPAPDSDDSLKQEPVAARPELIPAPESASW